ncbi:hypothetical protein [Pseudonocardia acidicola]|uniref:Uncharacterized protein n=1 Tax=Pseudonocardia acidicola TaxID=2724939 RepID=A0ABX1S5K7_9PSEU|nr:hypothetical protein [Pseudonocardia acidicola]NMH96865.1 hypothetical protein [Pseudonocardia acidicola]
MALELPIKKTTQAPSPEVWCRICGCRVRGHASGIAELCSRPCCREAYVARPEVE